MAERDRFEFDLAAALRDYAVEAPTEIRPVELARHFADAYPRGGGAVGRWRLVANPLRTVWVLLLLAALLVALVGGTLAVGSRLLESRDPLPKQLPGLLEGMVAEEVAPGVFRVVNDGVRDLTSVEGRDIMAGYDGGIWLLRKDGFLRLGSDVSYAWPAAAALEDCVLEVAPDGTMWAFGCGDLVRSTDGEEWTTVQPCPDGSTDCQKFTYGPDGMVWTSWSEGSGSDDEVRYRVSNLGPTGWQALGGDLSADLGFGRFLSTDAGETYRLAFRPLPVLQRYEDGVWQEEGSGFNVDVGPDGTVWADVMNRVGDPALPDHQAGLARLAGGEWELWAAADILPDIRFGLPFLGYKFEAAPDGSLWFSLWRSADDSDYFNLDSWECDGLARFDGETLDRFLPGRCLTMDIAADGSVWVLAADDAAVVPREGGFPDDQTWDLYVVTAKAMSR
jgi:hypothetical protein